MKNIHAVVLVFLCIFWGCSASIWIKNVISYGPTAANFGVQCLSKMSQLYLNENRLTRSRTMVVAYTTNLSLPADNVQRLYLKWVHEAIIHNEMDDMEIILISNAMDAKKASHVQSNTIFEKDYYVLIMDNFEKFNQLMRSYISQFSFNPGAKFLILFNNPNVSPTNATQRGLAYNLFRLMYDRYNAANVVFLYATDATQYNIYVTNPYRNKTKCGSLRPVLLDTCQNGVLKRIINTVTWVTEPHVPEVLPNCTFKFCARVAEPYVNPGCTTGLEIDIIHVLQHKLEFKLSTNCTKNLTRGEPVGDGTWTGILGMLRNDKCDFVVGGFFPDYDVHDDFGVTAAYLRDAYTWYVFVAKFRPEWLAMLMIFKYITWIGICVTFVVSAATWYFFGRVTGEKMSHVQPALCALNSFEVFLGLATNNRPKLGPLRIFFVALALYGLNITTIYTSKLIRVFTHPALENQIDTIEEVIASHLPIGGREEYREWFNNDILYDQTIYKLYDQSDLFSPTVENLADVALGKRVILVNRIYVLSKLIHNVYPMPFNVFINPLEMISERGFPLLRRFSNLIMFMRDAGVIEKLYDNFYYNMTTLQHIREIRNGDVLNKETNIVLTLGHLDGAFTLLILGLLISSVAFIVEVIVGTYKSRRRMKRLWKMVQNAWRQVSLMRLMGKKNATKTNAKYKRNAPKKIARKVKFNMSNGQAFKSNRW